ncbi:MAG: hypothetical protein ACLFQK_03170 [Fibrobacterota bacterium]
MKGRDSGMPAEDCRASFFDARGNIDVLVDDKSRQGNVVELLRNDFL